MGASTEEILPEHAQMVKKIGKIENI
jgi:hypothetical protein